MAVVGARKGPRMTRGNHPSPERTAILQAIHRNEQLHGVGLTVRAAAEVTGVDVDKARTAIYNMIHVNELRRLPDHSTPHRVVYGVGTIRADKRDTLRSISLPGSLPPKPHSASPAYLPRSAATAHAAATATQGDGPDHPRNMHNTAHYTGAELRPYTGRPGALDAYKLPSLIDGQRVDRRPPTIMSASPAQARTGHWV